MREEILNLSKLFNKKIKKVYPFINGNANVIVRRETNEIKAINERIENNKDSLQYYFDVPLNSSGDEMRVGNILYRVSKTGEIQMKLNWRSSVLNDMYYRKHCIGPVYHKVINQKCELSNYEKLDSTLNLNGKHFIAKDKFGSHKLINKKGEILTFPNRYQPIKCSENLVIGKRGKNYVLFNPENRMSNEPGVVLGTTVSATALVTLAASILPATPKASIHITSVAPPARPAKMAGKWIERSGLSSLGRSATLTLVSIA